jgi:hypothetical protein
MKLTDMIISAIIKKGIVYEARCVDTTIAIPMEHEGEERIIQIQFKAEHMTLKLDKAEA